MFEKGAIKFEVTKNLPKRTPVKHVLKCWPEFFDAIKNGLKKHDLRRSTDRNFCVGDELQLREYDPLRVCYTGRIQSVWVTYVTSSDLPCALSEDALGKDFCILSISTHPTA